LAVPFYGLKICILIGGNTGLKKYLDPRKTKTENLVYYIKRFFCDLDGVLIFIGIIEYGRLQRDGHVVRMRK